MGDLTLVQIFIMRLGACSLPIVARDFGINACMESSLPKRFVMPKQDQAAIPDLSIIV